MNTVKEFRGFTIIELMIVVGLLAILVALAYPSYGQYVRKANRSQAQQLLMAWSVNQEIWRSNHATYAGTGDGELQVPTHDDYTFSVDGTPTATTFVLRATPTGDQVHDKDNGVDCNPLQIDQLGVKSPRVCWGGSGS
jgi:type IV pilus assembly protein PilE